MSDSSELRRREEARRPYAPPKMEVIRNKWLFLTLVDKML